MGLTIYPAVDLRGGQVVRLRQGDPAAQTVFGADPLAVARHWSAAGAEWLHVVNLDGALGEPGSEANLRWLEAIARESGAPVQFGGGVRTLEDIARALDLGAARVVLGTVAAQQPEVVREALVRFDPERIVVGIDARAGRVATHGWQKMSEVPAVELARQMAALGVLRAVYTDIGRDGTLAGVNAAATAELARQSGLEVIASGGVSGLADIGALLPLADVGVRGVIIGQALYTGAIDLAAAIAAGQGLE